MAAPSIRGGRLDLVPFAESHITDDYLGWLNDTHLMRFSEQRHRVHTRESARDYLRSFDDTENRFWAILEYGEGLGHIGNRWSCRTTANHANSCQCIAGRKRRPVVGNSDRS